MKFVEKIKDLYNKTFNDEIIDIKPPREFWCDYRDIGRRLEGYKLKVQYKYKGWSDVFFSIDNDHLQLISKEKALKTAINFYEKVITNLQQSKGM